MYKQVIVVRTDLKMGKGKIASQVAHASLCAYLKSDVKVREKWLDTGAEKIVVKVTSKEELLDVYEKAKSLDLPCCLIKDSAKTQLKEPDYTCVGIGPAKEEEVDMVTGELKLL